MEHSLIRMPSYPRKTLRDELQNPHKSRIELRIYANSWAGLSDLGAALPGTRHFHSQPSAPSASSTAVKSNFLPSGRLYWKLYTTAPWASIS